MFGLIGTLTGALVTWWGQRALLARQERQRLQELQRTAACEFLAAADLFIAEADSLRYTIVDAELSEEQVQAVYGRYYERWAAFLRCRASVALTSTNPVREAGRPVLGAIYDLTNAADKIYENRRMPRGTGAWGPRYEAATSARDEFAAVVRRELGVPDVDFTAPRSRRTALQRGDRSSEGATA